MTLQLRFLRFGIHVGACMAFLSGPASAAGPADTGVQLAPEVLDALEQSSEQTRRRLESPRRPAATAPADAIRALEQAHEAGARPTREPRDKPSKEAIRGLEKADERTRIQHDDAALMKGIFNAAELRLDLSPETELVTRHGETFLTVQDFNQRVGRARGEDLYQARRNALDGMIRKRLLALMAEDAGLAEDPRVEQRVALALEETAHPGAALVNVDKYQIPDAAVAQYYREHLEAFRTPDIGTEVLLAVRGTEAAATALRDAIAKAPDDPRHWLGAEPIRGERLPQAVRDALFHAEPGDMTDVIATPAGWYVARLVARNPFDQALVQVRTFPSVTAAETALAEEAKPLFAAPAAEPSESDPATPDQTPGLVPMAGLPESVRPAVRLLDVGQVSEPIPAALGVMVVKLVARWSDAPIERATVIGVASKAEGEAVLKALADGATPAGIAGRTVTEADLPKPLLHLARSLKQGVFGGPVTTDLGTFLVRVDARRRQVYRPLAEVEDEIVRRLRAAKIPDDEKQAYYDAQRETFQLDAPVRVLDVLVSGGADDGLARLREVAAAATPAEREAIFDAILAERGVESVRGTDLPAAVAASAATLAPGQVSDVLTTDLGHFVVRLREVQDPAYARFGDVAEEIGARLADAAEEALALEALRAERDREIALEQARDRALAVAFERDFLRKLDNVSDGDARAWWQRNGRSMLAAFGANAADIDAALAEQPTMPMDMLKRNVLSERLDDAVDERRRAEQIQVYEYLLDY
ncbi:peptidyl-prolyl cis-trans isomerase [uncultured Thiohalocapsa sp.]|uniref:peptidyl-prolyl cis-trans isomerase n=1 Tax=uncultured Thiohalocapsa sp. TaxID=768990 RepID=UPI0025FA04D5|nr:peptidyl-prolyl cis-trans isomerase [uncultured Thiohalocapsa sp.]